MTKYDNSNIFAKILRSEIPCKKVYEDDDILCFYDINPIADTHVLVIPKREYRSFDDFVTTAEPEYISLFFNKVAMIAKKLGLIESGYRIISNHGLNANQEVPHFHVHLIGGENLGGIKYK
ncbi:MAG: putative HIT-like protein [Alphaproteobacteria bacterium MarineAlpha5_Bin11]|nr:histidine triad nucleotide-binding protein [Pelagibacteraceae bacterium]PPR44844.1 MAG: putative HIT-like protein [Alphaproteobacteria bacterium MarineAlpha5_Bin11]PPR51824.1 MAG: putative HIT-like protein [Alphaproteobacteria bacterium MarineAlpha5_Bin10]|tara:strand:+ start:9740 stop:10102 length:363 start_codon:yes stop_codon:yes gene_type:complete